jgi:hypothetical protein
MSKTSENVGSGTIYSRPDVTKHTGLESEFSLTRKCVSLVKDIPIGNQVLLAIHHKESILTIINATKDTKVVPYKFKVVGFGSDTRYVVLGDCVILDPFTTLRAMDIPENDKSFSKQQARYKEIRKITIDARGRDVKDIDAKLKLEQVEVIEYATVDESRIMTIRNASDFIDTDKKELAEATPAISLTTESD